MEVVEQSWRMMDEPSIWTARNVLADDLQSGFVRPEYHRAVLHNLIQKTRSDNHSHTGPLMSTVDRLLFQPRSLTAKHLHPARNGHEEQLIRPACSHPSGSRV